MKIDATLFETMRTAYGFTEARQLRWQPQNSNNWQGALTDKRLILKQIPFGRPWDEIIKAGELIEVGRCSFAVEEEEILGEYIFWARAWCVRLQTPKRYEGMEFSGHIVKHNPSSYWNLSLQNVYAEMREQVLSLVH